MMDDQSLAYLYDEYAAARAEDYVPTPEDWAEYNAYLELVELGDDDVAEYDADADRGFQNLDTDFGW